MGTDALPPTEERVSDDRLQDLINLYDGQAFRGDTVLAMEELQRLRHYVATCGGTDNDGRCPMQHLAGVSPEPAPATTDRVAPSFDAWWNDDAYGCLRYSDPVQFDRLRQAFNAGVAAARAAPEPDGMQVALDRACHTIMELMQAYERRIRSDCTTPEQLAAKPWECAEYIRGARYLKAVWKDGRAQPFAALDEFLGYLRSSETKPAPAAQPDMVPACCYAGPCDYKSPPIPVASSLTKAEVRPPFCGYCGDAGTVPNNSPGAPDLPCPRCSLNGGAGK